MKFVIRPAARQDILKQFLYLLEKDASAAAARFLAAVETTISKLSQQPTIGAPKKFKNPRLQGLRRWPVDGFEVVGIYYLLAEDVLRVIRVLHGKRHIERILGEQTEQA